MSEFCLHCYRCDTDAPMSDSFVCGVCGEPRSILALAAPPRALFESAPRDLWHYRALLPVTDAACVVSLGEGATPLVAAPRLAARHGFGEVRIKNEGANPTGSFKDRQISVGISHAREVGADTVAVVSSGNVAAATSAYAARAGMRAVLFMHGHASPAKIAQAALYGATVLCVDSPSPKAVFEVCLEACTRWGWRHLSTAGMYEPWNVEGAKTIAYELFWQYGGALPEWIVAPVGGGGLLGGVWRGLMDLRRLGLVAALPRLVGVQAAGCAPLAEAMASGEGFLETLRHPWPDPKTIAGGIADDILFDGHTVLPAIRRTEGLALAVEDPAIEHAVHALAESEGLLCEVTSGVVFAGLAELERVAGGQRVCCLMTGNGIKDIGFHAGKAVTPVRIPASVEAVAEVVGGE